MDKSFLAAKQKGSLLAGSRYEKALEFFIRTRSSQIDGRANSKDIERVLKSITLTLGNVNFMGTI